MKEIRFHGRGGQGAVTAAELLAQAAIESHLYAQAFPSFGAERRGAPVMAFLRVSESPIFLRERIDRPDVVVVLDPTLIGLPEVTEGLAAGKQMIINVAEDRVKLLDDLSKRFQISIVDASKIAMETIGLPITNTAILGALVKATGLVELESFHEPFMQRFNERASSNLSAMTTAREQTILLSDPAPNQHPAREKELDYDSYIIAEALCPWQQMERGCDVVHPGSSRAFLTGNWRTAGYPQRDMEKCISCGICWIMCPEMAFSKDEKNNYSWRGNYCKGCGLCVATCPKGALSMEEE